MSCQFCGALDDGNEGWKQDHEIVCASAPKNCPCRQYGCTALIEPFRIGEHLRMACPVAVSPCRLQRSVELPNIMYEIRTNTTPVSDSCGTCLRRFDVERHHLFAHPDLGLLIQPCPYTACVISFHSKQGRICQNPKTVTAASPLYPPPQYLERKGKLSVNQFCIDSRSLKSKTETFADTDGNFFECGYRRRQLKPIFSKLSTLPSTSRLPCPAVSGDLSFGDVLGNMDIFLRILENLSSDTLQLFACVNKASRSACDDHLLKDKRCMVSLKWRRIDENNEVRWTSALVWEKPNFSPHIVRWDFAICAPWIHWQRCSSKKSGRSLQDMEIAAQMLGQVAGSADFASYLAIKAVM